MSIKLLRRGLIVVAMLPMLWIGAAGARYVLYERRVDRLSSMSAVARFPEPGPSSRILVISPHPDDETLGCGGLLQRCTAARGVAHVVFMTDGDGFRVGVERQFRTIRATPADFRRFAAMRREEAHRACSLLGVSRRSISFMGFPDGGLDRLLTTNWSDSTPLRSRDTGLDACAPGSERAGAPYSGESLLAALTEQLERFRPNMVLVTHPADDHKDHSATAAFTSLALARLRYRGVEWAKHASLYSYLIHRGDWPRPQGMSTHTLLRPPAEMLGLEGDWLSLPLTRAQIARKSDALSQYETQMAVMRRFLISFVRASEVFWPDPGARIDRIGSASDPRSSASDRFRPIVLDAIADNVVRAVQPEADIRSVSAVMGGEVLYVVVSTARPVSPQVRTRVTVRKLEDPDKSGDELVVAEAKGARATRSSNAPSWDAKPGIGFAIPVGRAAEATYLIIDTQTRIGMVPVDRTGPRVVSVLPPTTN